MGAADDVVMVGVEEDEALVVGTRERSHVLQERHVRVDIWVFGCFGIRFLREHFAVDAENFDTCVKRGFDSA